MHVVSKPNLKLFVCFSMVMHFTGAKYLKNNLKETRYMTIFVLLCKIYYSVMLKYPICSYWTETTHKMY